MPLKQNPNFNIGLPESATNQRYIFENPAETGFIKPSNVAITPSGAQVDIITGELLTPVTPFKTETPAPIPPLNVANLPKAEISVAPPTEATTLTSQLESLQLELLGAPAAKAGRISGAIESYQKQLNEINARIAMHQAAALERQEKALESGETLGYAAGEAGRIARTDAIEAMKLSAQAQAMQGNITLAKELAENAVDGEYAEKLQKLTTTRNNIIANWDTFTAAERKRAEATLARIDAEDAFVKEQKQTSKDIQDIIIKVAATGNATNEDLDKIKKSKDVVEATQLAAPFLEEILSVSEAKILGVPYGTTKGQATKMGITPKGISIADLTPAQQSAAFKLSDDFEQASKDFFKVRDAYNRVIASAIDPSAAGDLALIFNYMKVLDPGSVVREGEFATAANTGSIPEIIYSRYNKVLRGERLSENIRADFVERSEKLFEGALKQQQEVSKTYSKRAEAYGIPADFVVREIESAIPQLPKPPKTDEEAQNILENISTGKPIVPTSTFWSDAWDRITNFFGY